MSDITSVVVPLGGYAAKQCPTSVYHDIVTDPALAAEDTPGAQARMADGVTFETEVGALLTDALGLIDLSEVKLRGNSVKTLATQLAGLRAVAIPACDRSDKSKARRELLTMAAMRAGVGVIWNARFPVDYVGGRTGEPDMLVAAGVLSAEGKPAYHPVDVKHHKSLEGAAKAKPFPVSSFSDPSREAAADTVIGAGSSRHDDDMQLAHYYRMLQTLGHAASDAHGAIIGKEKLVVWRRLDVASRGNTALENYDEAWAVVRHVADEAVAHPENGPASPCMWGPECKESKWRVVMHDDLVASDSIVLLPGVTARRYKVHAARGVTTRAQLARLDWATAKLVDAGADVLDIRSKAAAYPNQDAPATTIVAAGVLDGTGLETVGDLARLCVRTAAYAGSGKTLATEIDQARVTKVGKVHRSRNRGCVSTSRATFELDVDIEDADGRCYLIGVADSWRRTRGGSTKVRTDFHAFVDWSRSDDGEARIFADFWSYLTAQQAKAAEQKWGFKVYHYTDHETRYFRSLARKHAGRQGIPTLEELEAFFASDAWVDLHKVVATELIWPTEDLSLKTVAKHTGFAWRDEEPGGANSIAWFLDATGSPLEAVREANRERILAYNEDDVMATLAIRDWLTRQGEARRPGERIPSVETLEARFRRPVRRAA